MLPDQINSIAKSQILNFISTLRLFSVVSHLHHLCFYKKCPGFFFFFFLSGCEYFQQNTATVTHLMAKMASWLTPLLPDQESAATLTLTTMSSGHLERDKVGKQVAEASAVHAPVTTLTWAYGRLEKAFDFSILCLGLINFHWTFWHSTENISAIWKLSRKGKSLLCAFALRTLTQIV